LALNIIQDGKANFISCQVFVKMAKTLLFQLIINKYMGSSDKISVEWTNYISYFNGLISICLGDGFFKDI